MTDTGAVIDDAEPSFARILGLVRDVPDYPHPGILFRDITPVLADAEAFATLTTELASLVEDADIVVGIEARGFLLGAAVAVVAGTGIVPVRKAGKLPCVAASRSYDLEYGTATLELPADTLAPGVRAFVVDDVLATGGTAAAACALLAHAGVEVIGFGVLLELVALGGRDRLGGIDVHALIGMQGVGMQGVGMQAEREMAAAELARRVGVMMGNLPVLKNNRAKVIRFSTLTAICEVLDCQPGDLFVVRRQLLARTAGSILLGVSAA